MYNLTTIIGLLTKTSISVFGYEYYIMLKCATLA